MTATVSKAGPYYTSGEIKFSSLRTNFRTQIRKETSSGSETFTNDTNEIKASQFRRDTTTTNTNPIVPDATENANISTSSDWKTSQFRGSIKFFYIAQSETDINFDIDAQSWNGNLNKNIPKFLFVNGTCGSYLISTPAAQLSATAYNLTIDTYGSILAAGGKGGGMSGGLLISGENGGDALEMTSSDGANNIVLLRSGAQIYGGGAGGERGLDGSAGSPGTCTNYATTSGCGGAPGCPSGYTEYSSGSGGCCQTYSYCCGLFNCGCTACSQYTRYRYCIQQYASSGGTGGAGGNGGHGRGYNYLPPDPYFSQVSLLMPCDGSNGSTSATDYSNNTKTITFTGGAVVSTTQSKFGGSSLYFPGGFPGGQDIVTNSSNDFAFGTDPFTIEFWYYHSPPTPGIQGGGAILVRGNYTYTPFPPGSAPLLTDVDWYVQIQPNGTLGYPYYNVLFYRLDGTPSAMGLTESGSTTTAFPEHTWTHLVITRESDGYFYSYVNGVKSAKTAFSPSSPQVTGSTEQNATPKPLYLSGMNWYGSPNPAINWTIPSVHYSYMDELRITKGVARYTTNFTPPVAPLSLNNNPLTGSLGSPGGAGGGCGATNGTAGENGGAGGDWALNGQNTTNTGSGGSAGRAIFGSNYSVTGIINSSTIKGLYLP